MKRKRQIRLISTLECLYYSVCLLNFSFLQDAKSLLLFFIPGSDAVVYQMFRSLGLKPTCRVIYEQLKVPFIAFQDKPQKNCCWVPDAPVTDVQDFELETPNRLSPTVIYIKAGAMPLQDDNISNHPACLSCRNEAGFTHTPSLSNSSYLSFLLDSNQSFPICSISSSTRWAVSQPSLPMDPPTASYIISL